MTLNDYLASRIRTVVPVIVGSVLAVLVKRIPALAEVLKEGEVSAWLVPLSIAVYYNVVRWLEKRYPQAGWLLGLAKQPEYAGAPAVAEPSELRYVNDRIAPVPPPIAETSFSRRQDGETASHEVPAELLRLHEELEQAGVTPEEFAATFGDQR